MENIEVKMKSVSDIFKPQTKPYHCEKCMMDFHFPTDQKKGLICPFCQSKLKSGSCKKPETEIDENKTNQIYLVVVRDESGKIIRIEEMDKDEYEKKTMTSEENKEFIKNVKEKTDLTNVKFSKISPLNEMDETSGISLIVYKASDFCGVSSIIEGMLRDVETRIKKENASLPFDFRYKVCVKNEKSYTDKRTSFFPQVAVFFKGKKEYLMEFIKIKDFNVDTVFNKLLYWKVLFEKGLIQ